MLVPSFGIVNFFAKYLKIPVQYTANLALVYKILTNLILEVYWRLPLKIFFFSFNDKLCQQTEGVELVGSPLGPTVENAFFFLSF